MIYDDGEDCVVTLRDHDGLENDDVVNEIYRGAYIRVQQIALLLKLPGGRNHSLLGNNVSS